jgi:hypothetical protein
VRHLINNNKKEKKMEITLKNVKHYESMSEETYCFEASLYADGKRVGRVSNRGTGGCHDYDFDMKTERELDEWCRTNLPKWTFEAETSFGDEEHDTDLEMHISNLVTDFLDNKHLKNLLNKSVIVMDDNCEEGEVYQWKFSKYKGRAKTEVIGGVTNAIAKNEKMVNPVVLNSLSLYDAKKVYFRK